MLNFRLLLLLLIILEKIVVLKCFQFYALLFIRSASPMTVKLVHYRIHVLPA